MYKFFISLRTQHKMTKSEVELNQTESIVFGTIKNHQPVSSILISHYTGLSTNNVEKIIDRLVKLRVITLGAGGVPKRYKIAGSTKKGDEDDQLPRSEFKDYKEEEINNGTTA